MDIPNIAKYIHQVMKTKDLVSMNASSAMPSMTTEILNNLLIIIPDKSQLEKYEKIANKLYQHISENNKQIQLLTKLRDTLLTKLMSGNLRVK